MHSLELPHKLIHEFILKWSSFYSLDKEMEMNIMCQFGESSSEFLCDEPRGNNNRSNQNAKRNGVDEISENFPPEETKKTSEFLTKFR